MPMVPSVAKILAKMRNNPRDWRIEDLQVVARHFGIEYSQYRTSHCTFRHPKAGRLTVPDHRQFVEFTGRVKSDEQEV